MRSPSCLGERGYSVRAFCARCQVHIGPFQREQFTIRAHPGIDRQNRCIAEILGSLRQILCLFRKAQHAVPALGLRQFVDGGHAVQSAPLHCKVKNPPQRAQIAVHGHNGILWHLLPVPRVPAHCLACNRVQRGICDSSERQQPVKAHAVESVRSRLCVRLGILQEFFGECPEDRRAQSLPVSATDRSGESRQASAPADARPLRPLRLFACVSWQTSNAKTLVCSVCILECPAEVIPVDFAALIDHPFTSLFVVWTSICSCCPLAVRLACRYRVTLPPCACSSPPHGKRGSSR